MIEVENLSKVYVDTPAVDDVTFFVPEGQVLGFLGPNGAGKTTAMRMLTTFLRPTAGTITVAGVNADDDPVGLRRNIGYLPENAPLYPEMRVDEFLRFRSDIEEVPHRYQRVRVDDVVDRCLLGEVRRQVIGTLSKGYRQRVGLAGALIHQPPVLILDEPTVGLDPNQIIRIRELLIELGRDHTVLLSTHILPEVETVCDRVLIINKGRIVADGTPDGLRSRMAGRPTLDVVFKDAPEDRALDALEALPGILGVRALGDGRFCLECDGAGEPQESIFRLAVDSGWPLLEMSPGKASLEEVFVRLTTDEQACPAEEV
ncbi:MAG: ATP-binding cassette domain-containing protein [Acidobacteria bacterium]|nr:ATP-binding cassette domain-containing protein [Acidobacteriota bacterium]